jgi:hypothetical protein
MDAEIAGQRENRNPRRPYASGAGNDPLAGAFLISGARNTFDISNHQRSPARLMACTQALAGFAVKILVEQCSFRQQESWRKTGIVAMTRPPAGASGRKMRQTAAQSPALPVAGSSIFPSLWGIRL